MKIIITESQYKTILFEASPILNFLEKFLIKGGIKDVEKNLLKKFISGTLSQIEKKEFKKFLNSKEGNLFLKSLRKNIEDEKDDAIKLKLKGWLDFNLMKFAKSSPPESTLSKLKKKLVTRTTTPIGYDPLKPLAVPGELMLPKMTPKTWATQNRMDAWYLYNGLKPKYNSFEQIGDNVYRIKKFNIEEKVLDKIIKYPSNKFPSVNIENELNFGAIHGNGMIEKGVDSKGRKYIEFSDLWDLQPLKKFKFLPNKLKNFEVSSLSGGKPFWTKNRIYYDDFGNFFDVDGTKLIKKSEFVKNGDFKGFVTNLGTKNLGNITQQEILNDWNKLASSGIYKAVLVPIAGIVGLILHSLDEHKKFYLKVTKAAKDKKMSINQFKYWCTMHSKECNTLLK